MGFELVTAPTQEPVSLSEVKDFLRYYDSDEDGLILSRMEAARLMIESRTQRQLVTATWKLHLPYFPMRDIEIRKVPVASITSISYYDINGVSQTWDSAEYESDLISFPAVIRTGYGYSFPSTRSDKLNAVSIQFVAGSTVANVDRRAKHAILFWVRWLFDNNEQDKRVAEDFIDSLKWTAYAGVV